MFAIVISLILFYRVNDTFATRLPLEVFEIPQTTTQAQVYNQNSSAISSSTATTADSSSSYVKQKSIFNHHLDRRRSRQMLDILQRTEHQLDNGLEEHPATTHMTKILYQIGDSEEDLPICAPNAVCSKIDLYETPWIERQCRCPDALNNKGPFTITHRKEHHHFGKDKLQPLLEIEKKLQQKRLLDYDENKVENSHLRKLFQKLGAVYHDDLDEIDGESDEITNNNAYQVLKNDFPMKKSNRPSFAAKTHMRHGGHKSKDIPHIGGCPSSLGVEDGHTIADKTRHYKMCNPVHKLPVCRYFRDYTWTLSTSPEMNVTEQIVHCRCPRNSVTYLTKREPLPGGTGYTYLFACSPQTRLRCQRKEPCKLFTVRKRQEFLDEVNTNSLCQCPKEHRCPRHHTDVGVIAGESFIEDNIQTYSGYCMAND